MSETTTQKVVFDVPNLIWFSNEVANFPCTFLESSVGLVCINKLQSVYHSWAFDNRTGLTMKVYLDEIPVVTSLEFTFEDSERNAATIRIRSKF